MRIKVDIAVYQSKALFKGFYRPFSNFIFIKGTLHSLHKMILHMYGSAIPDCLDDSTVDVEVLCVCVLPFYAKI